MITLKKTFDQYLKFIAQVKSGKRAIIINRDYVVISRNIYDKLIKDKDA